MRSRQRETEVLYVRFAYPVQMSCESLFTRPWIHKGSKMVCRVRRFVACYRRRETFIIRHRPMNETVRSFHTVTRPLQGFQPHLPRFSAGNVNGHAGGRRAYKSFIHGRRRWAGYDGCKIGRRYTLPRSLSLSLKPSRSRLQDFCEPSLIADVLLRNGYTSFTGVLDARGEHYALSHLSR